MNTYNGFKSRAYWNVSSWINNDQGLYNLALESLNATKNTKSATNYFLFMLADNNKTLDGYKFNSSNVYPVLSTLKKSI